MLLSELQSQFKQHFRNISRIMDCVGCEKCRLWGKIQVSDSFMTKYLKIIHMIVVSKFIIIGMVLLKCLTLKLIECLTVKLTSAV